jgi:uncharacterized protein YbjT (DUF2867 family)
MKVLVTGAAGMVGSAVVKELLKRDANVRVLVRKRESADKFGSAVEVAVGDLLDPVSIELALQGVDKLYLLNAVVADELTQALITYGVARRMGIRHVVYHSVFLVEQFRDVPHFASKHAVEEALREFDVPSTIIRPGYFMQNDAAWKDLLMGPGIYPSPIGSVGIAAVDVRDIAEATAIAITGAGHEGKTYDLVGPALLSGPSAAAMWSGVLRKEIKYPGENLDALESQMRQTGPSWSAFDIRMMYQGYLERGFASTNKEVEILTQLLGHAPRSYGSFAAETASLWQ